MDGVRQEAPTPDRKCLVEVGLGQADCVLNGDYLEDFTEDAVRVISGGVCVRNATLIDARGEDDAYRDEAHRDGIQLIPKGDWQSGKGFIVPRAQYASGLIDGLLVENCHIRSRGQLQGIFMSDGRANSVAILSNVIQTAGFHSISLSGVHSGHIQGNVKEDGTPCPVHLWPNRIGGNMDGDIVCVVGYSDPRYEMQPLEVIMPDEYERSFAKDRRTVIKDNPNVTYLTDFDQDGFWSAVEKMDVSRDVLAHTKALKTLAREFGERVFAV